MREPRVRVAFKSCIPNIAISWQTCLATYKVVPLKAGCQGAQGLGLTQSSDWKDCQTVCLLWLSSLFPKLHIWAVSKHFGSATSWPWVPCDPRPVFFLQCLAEGAPMGLCLVSAGF